MPPQFISFCGLFVFMFIAWSMSTDRRRVPWRLVISGLLIQFGLGLFLLRTTIGTQLYQVGGSCITFLIECSNQGSAFLFGSQLVNGHDWTAGSDSLHLDVVPAFTFLPAIIFIGALTSLLFYLGILQWIVRGMARVMVLLMDTSGTESLAASANVFVGMTEAPLVIRPYLKTMTRSELMAMMTSGMATIAGGMMAIYATILASVGIDPGHLLAASLMSVPASLVIAKLMVPETELSPTKGKVTIEIPRTAENALDATCRGASDGLKLALNVAAMLIAFVALIYMVNQLLAFIPHADGTDPITLQLCLGYVFRPLAYLMGISWDESLIVGQFLGEKTVLNECLAYLSLAGYEGELSERARVITTYALCGFANFGSVAILIGGVGSLVPERRAEFAQLGLRSLIGGTLAAFMTAAIAGVLL